MNIQTRKPTNLSLDRSLLDEARALDVNLSRAAEEGLRAAVAEAKGAQWLAENQHAIEGSNAYVAAHGLPLDRFRQF
jgi:antitoxin CcdA